MCSPKLLLLLICVISSVIILCDGFKLHLNRDLKDKETSETDNAERSKFKFKPLKVHVDEKSSISVEDDSEELVIHKVENVVMKQFVKSEETSDEKDDIKVEKLLPKVKKVEAKVKTVEDKAIPKTDKIIQDDVTKPSDTTKSLKPLKQEHQKLDISVSKVDKTVTIKEKEIPEKTKTDGKKPDLKITKKKDDILLKDKLELKNDTAIRQEKKEAAKPEATKKTPNLDTDTKKSDKIEITPVEQPHIPEKTDKITLTPKHEDQDQKLLQDKEKKVHSKLDAAKSDLVIESGPESNGNLEQEQFNILYRLLPSFAPNYNIVKNDKCRREGQIFLRQLRGHKLWALQMLDASAKFPSGILRGNLNQLGDYDACLDAFARVKVHQDKAAVPVRGKYCLAEIDFAAVAEGARYPVHLLQARNFIRSNRKDTGHFIPKFTTINWAICLPSACTAQDAEDILLDAISPYNMTTGLKISLDVKDDMCYTKKHVEWWRHSPETLATLGFYIFIVGLACLATLKDCWQSWTDVADTKEQHEDVAEYKETTSKQKDGFCHKILMSFSIKRSCEELLKNEQTSDDIQCIHGIRAVTTLILYCAHKLLPIARIPFSNRTFLTELANSQWSVFLRVSLIYTDTFLLLSGVLSAYNMSKDMMTKGEISWFKRLITRYIRLTPALAAVVLFYAYIWDHIGGGPQWSNVVSANARLCQNNLWKNLLYIQNFYPFEEMCATHTHQLALDMQLTILAPILVWFLYKAPMWGLALLGGFHSLSVGLRYFSTLNHRLSLVIFHGISLSQLIRTANLTYAIALHRATPYLTGVGLGVMLKNTEKNVRLPKVIVALGWLGALYFFGWTFNAPAHLAKRDYQYNVEEAAQFAASSSVAWALALSWLIFACHTNNGGSINSFLCSRPLILLSRISYAIYLVQFIIFFYNVGTYRSSTVFDVTQSFNVLEFVAVIIASIVVTLLFDTPMQAIKNIIMKSSNNQKPVEVLENIDDQHQEENVTSESEHEEYVDYQYHNYNSQETADISHDYEDETGDENQYYRQESQDSQAINPMSEREMSFDDELSTERDPNSESAQEYSHDLHDYEYNDDLDEEDATEPTTEREIDGEDHDLKDWEWTENEDKRNDDGADEN